MTEVARRYRALMRGRNRIIARAMDDLVRYRVWRFWHHMACKCILEQAIASNLGLAPRRDEYSVRGLPFQSSRGSVG